MLGSIPPPALPMSYSPSPHYFLFLPPRNFFLPPVNSQDSYGQKGCIYVYISSVYHIKDACVITSAPMEAMEV